MLTYTVKYKKVGAWFWRKLKHVEGDGINESARGQAVPSRFFVLSDKTRIELSIPGMMFKFDSKRHEVIAASMNNQMGRV